MKEYKQNSVFKPMGIPILGWIVIFILFIGVGNINRFVGYVKETYASGALETKIVNDTINYMKEIKGYGDMLESSSQGNYEQYQEELKQALEFFDKAYKDYRYDAKDRLLTPGKSIKPLFITMSYCLDRYKFTIYTEKNRDGKNIFKVNTEFLNQARAIDTDISSLLDRYNKNEIKLPVPDYDYMKKYDIPGWYKLNY